MGVQLGITGVAVATVALPPTPEEDDDAQEYEGEEAVTEG
jgi:hypothetical protein